MRLTVSDSARRSIAQLSINQQAQLETFAVIEGTDFANGIIEAEIAGAPAPDAAAGARGFVGIAFRLQPDLKTYDAFYLRPTNGRADDQERRNHSTQYISHPDWTWDRMRRETPSRYESYVDLEPGVWTKIRIEVRGDTARLFVHGQLQPTLIVNDVKTGEGGARRRGAVDQPGNGRALSRRAYRDRALRGLVAPLPRALDVRPPLRCAVLAGRCARRSSRFHGALHVLLPAPSPSCRRRQQRAAQRGSVEGRMHGQLFVEELEASGASNDVPDPQPITTAGE